MKHAFRIWYPYEHQLSVMIQCDNCPDPEPDTVDYIWADSDGTVYFDGNCVEELFLFLAHHDAFRLTEPADA